MIAIAAVVAYALLGGGSSTTPSTTPVVKDGVLTAVPMQTVVLLVDVSGSMRATDIEPTRLDGAIAAMEMFLERLPVRLDVGVIAFSSTVEVLQPVTSDRGRVLKVLHLLKPKAATALGDGLAEAVKFTAASLAKKGIRQAPGQDLPAVIVLESDGAQTRGTLKPLVAAELARRAGVRVDGIALGTASGAVTFGFGAYKQKYPVPPDPKTVVAISRITGGTSFTATTAARLEEIYTDLATTIGS